MYRKPSDRLRQFFSRSGRFYEEFWALRDVSFEISAGRIVGLIGKNGSGKSTLLQIVAGTMQPTMGKVNVDGKVSALLELGSGFNPEFTGRENIYMNAAILGMSRDEIDERLDEIVEFADIGDFIDQQVKTYSSGMFVRLAFSVSTALRPEVLIVDEALSVGDVAFQKKCFSRIKALIEGGTTVLLVSHDMSTIRLLCDTVVYLENGSVKAIGDPKTVVDEFMKDMLGKDDYLASHERQNPEQFAIPSSWSNKAWSRTPSSLKHEFEQSDHTEHVNGSLKAVVEKCMVLSERGDPIIRVQCRGRYLIRCLIRAREPLAYFNVGVLIRDKYGQDVFGQSISNLGLEIDDELREGDVVVCDIAVELNLKHGVYFVTLGIQDAGFDEIFYYGTDILSLEIEASDHPIFGLVELPCSFSVNKMLEQGEGSHANRESVTS